MPEALGSDGPDAVDLAASYGLVADPWQADVLHDWGGRLSDGTYAARTCGLACPRQNGKNGILEIRELYGMAVLGEKFLHTAHEVKTARKAFLRIASFFENPRDYPELAALCKTIRKTNGQEAIYLTNGGSIEFIARSSGSGRGFTVDVLVLDESQDLTDTELAALLPTISAAPLGNPQVLITGTPPSTTRKSAGAPFRRVRADGESLKDDRLAWTDFGVADGPMPDVEDRGSWSSTNPALGGRLGVSELERELRLMNPETFAQERLGWWGDPKTVDDSVIDLNRWGKLADPDAVPSGSVVLVVDVSPDRRKSSLGLATRIPGDRVLVVTYTAGGTDWVVPKLVEILAARDVAEVGILPASQAGALVPDLLNAGIRFRSLTTAEAGAGCAAFQTMILHGRLSHVGQPELDAAVGNARTRYLSGGEIEVWDRRQRDIDISPLVSASNAVYRLSLLGGSDYDVLDSFM